MGQYYKLVNLDRKEFLNPHDWGDGVKLMEFGCSGNGTLAVLAGLLAFDAQQRGPWAGSRLVITGDYADEGRFVPAEFAHTNLYSYVDGVEPPEGEEGASSAPFDELKDAALAQLRGLGIELCLRKPWNNSREASPHPALTGEATYDQPEDLFDAFGLLTSEALVRVIEGITRELRVTNVRSPFAWDSVTDAVLDIDIATGRATALRVRFQPREQTSPARVRTLAFPATVASVRAWLEVPDDTLPQLTDGTPVRLA